MKELTIYNNAAQTLFWTFLDDKSYYYMVFPARVWEPSATVRGKRLWVSRDITADDYKSRLKLFSQFANRRNNKIKESKK